MAHSGAFHVLQALQHNVESEAVQLAGCDVITAALTPKTDEVMMDEGVRTGLIVHVSAMLRRYSHVSRVVSAACRAIGALHLPGDVLHVDSVGHVRVAISRVVALLENHMDATDVSTAACAALAELCVGGPAGIAQAVIRSNGFVRLSAALDTHARVVGVVSSCCQVLEALCTGGPAVDYLSERRDVLDALIARVRRVQTMYSLDDDAVPMGTAVLQVLEGIARAHTSTETSGEGSTGTSADGDSK